MFTQFIQYRDMYVTRRLSEYRKNPSELKKPPPEGPNSGVLVIQDEEALTTSCFGLCYEDFLRGLPFPQNAALTIRRDYAGPNNTVHRDPVVFIPVLGQPLSSNRYYTYERCGYYSRESSTSDEREVERVTCCFCIRFNHVHMYKKPQPDPYDIHQQFTFQANTSYSRCYYFANPVVPNGLVPLFLSRKGMTIENSNSLRDFGLIDDAKGLNIELRSKLPSLEMSIVVGKWYVPFIFVKEGDIIDQVKISMYYNMTLHQRWEEIFFYENVCNEDCEAVVDVDVEIEALMINIERQKVNIDTISVDAKGIVWFQVVDHEGQEKKIGLRSVVVDRMKSVQKSFGWKKIDGNRVAVKRLDRFGGSPSDWKRYRCYVLVESFELKRMDGTLVLTYEFRHVNKLRSLRSTWD